MHIIFAGVFALALRCDSFCDRLDVIKTLYLEGIHFIRSLKFCYEMHTRIQVHCAVFFVEKNDCFDFIPIGTKIANAYTKPIIIKYITY